MLWTVTSRLNKTQLNLFKHHRGKEQMKVLEKVSQNRQKCVGFISEEGMAVFPTLVANIVYIGSRPKGPSSWNNVPTPDEIRSIQNINTWLVRRKIAPEDFVLLISDRGSPSSASRKPPRVFPTPVIAASSHQPPRVTPLPQGFAADGGNGFQWRNQSTFGSKPPVNSQNNFSTSSKLFPDQKPSSIHERLGWMANQSAGNHSQSE